MYTAEGFIILLENHIISGEKTSRKYKLI